MTGQMQMAGFRADPGELSAFLEAYPELEFFDLVFTGLSGVPRGKRLRRSELASLYAQGRFLPGSVLAVDMTGQDVEESGLVWDNGDADLVAWPVPGGIVPAPWLGEGMGQVTTSLHGLDGPVSPLDPRAVLAGVLERFTEIGMTPVVACELEFYLLDAQRGADGGVSMPRSALTGRAPAQTQVYGLAEIEEEAGFLHDLWAACDAAGIPLEGAISECAPGQFELTLHHVPDALRAADHAVAYKRIAKSIAARHARTATFMAKPFAELAGSGLHLHLSLADERGSNLMAHEAREGTPLVRHAIAGMQALLGESWALFAPGMNSFRRFRANSYAPVSGNWGVNNRTVAFRIPAGAAPTRHIEHRVCGADANPHLALAALLAASHHGIVNRLDPGEAVTGNGYEASSGADNARVPNWFSALDAFAGSALLRDYLGDAFVDLYTCVKRTEQDRFLAQVTSLDYDWYLHGA